MTTTPYNQDQVDRFEFRNALGKAAYESHRQQTDIGYDTEWEDLPNGTQTEWRNIGEAVHDMIASREAKP